MNTITKNWKTTLGGIILVVCVGVAHVYPQYAGIAQAVATGAVGFGLIAAQDGNITGQ